MLFMGVAALLGPPFAATLKNWTNSFDVSFYVMGALMIASGVVSLPLRYAVSASYTITIPVTLYRRINKWEMEREQASNLELEPLNDDRRNVKNA